MNARFHTDARKGFCFHFSGKPIFQMEIGPVSLQLFLEKYFDLEKCEWGSGEDNFYDLIVSLNFLPEKFVLKEFLIQASGIDAPVLLKSRQNGEILARWHCDVFYEEKAEIIWTDIPPIPLSYYWDLLTLHEKVAPSFISHFENGAVSSLATINGVLEMGEGSSILPGVVIEGFVRIGKYCKIGPNSFIRGCTSIGDNCFIGQGVEIKNSIIGSGTMIPHLSYIGDSVLGANINVGAGSVCSNFRHDEGLHRVMIGETLMNTERQKLGALLGDGVKLGCHTVIYPGRIMASGRTSLPGEIISRNKE